jgi:hypothetical protein
MPAPRAAKDPDEVLWGAKAIGTELNIPERKARWVIEHGHIKGVKKVGHQYAGARRAIRNNVEVAEA